MIENVYDLNTFSFTMHSLIIKFLKAYDSKYFNEGF